MNLKSLVIVTALAGGLLSAPAVATTTAAHDQSNAAVRLELPALIKVVPPTDLPASARGATVTLRFTVDASGFPHDIRIVSRGDQNLRQQVVSAVSQWQFTPACRNGVAVPVKVELPVQLVDS